MSQVELEAQRPPLLPVEMFAVCAVAPLATTPLINPHVFSQTRELIIRDFASMELAFLTMPLGFWLLYRYAVPHVLPKLGKAGWVLHAVVPFVFGPLFAWVIYPVHAAVCANDFGVDKFVQVSIIFSCMCLWASLAFQRLRQKARAAERQALVERQAALRAQLTALQARTNPHFLFNSINTVASLIPDDPELAERTLERLADLFRYALDSTKMRTVPLSRELEMVNDYLAIQRARFGDRLETKVELDPAAADYPVPPLLLQPLVENAVLHGLAERAKGRVTLTVHKRGDTVTVEVTDDGPGPGQSSHQGTGTSVRELGERLKLVYGQASRLELLAAPGGGCLARVQLPAAGAAT
ncbi:MAG: histidine kinase [Myxococcaceae bacterium]|nr:histidine kinase [Myxococcaceae bacterium]